MLNQIRANFANAARSSSRDGKSQEEYEEIGVKRFKRKTLGLCGDGAVKSVDELALILTDMGVASSMDKGRGLLEQFDGEALDYGRGYLTFKRTSEQGREAFIIGTLPYLSDLSISYPIDAQNMRELGMYKFVHTSR